MSCWDDGGETGAGIWGLIHTGLLVATRCRAGRGARLPNGLQWSERSGRRRQRYPGILCGPEGGSRGCRALLFFALSASGARGGGGLHARWRALSGGGGQRVTEKGLHRNLCLCFLGTGSQGKEKEARYVFVCRASCLLARILFSSCSFRGLELCAAMPTAASGSARVSCAAPADEPPPPLLLLRRAQITLRQPPEIWPAPGRERGPPLAGWLAGSLAAASAVPARNTMPPRDLLGTDGLAHRGSMARCSSGAAGETLLPLLVLALLRRPALPCTALQTGVSPVGSHRACEQLAPPVHALGRSRPFLQTLLERHTQRAGGHSLAAAPTKPAPAAAPSFFFLGRWSCWSGAADSSHMRLGRQPGRARHVCSGGGAWQPSWNAAGCSRKQSLPCQPNRPSTPKSSIPLAWPGGERQPGCRHGKEPAGIPFFWPWHGEGRPFTAAP